METKLMTIWHVEFAGVRCADWTDTELVKVLIAAKSIKWSKVDACFTVKSGGITFHVWPHYAELGEGAYF